jgi:hypothetical protein
VGAGVVVEVVLADDGEEDMLISFTADFYNCFQRIELTERESDEERKKKEKSS